MNPIRVFVRRPVLTTMLLVAMVVMGLYTFRRTIVELMPKIDFPYVVVTTIYPGASPSEVESQVTKKIEDAVSTLANIESLESYSMENSSLVLIEFALETDVDLDAIDVKDKVDAILIELPEDIEKPIIQKFDITSSPIIDIAVSGPRSLEEIYEIADKTVRERLSRVDGVAEVQVTGKREREVRVAVHPERLRAYGLTMLDVAGVVAAGNLNVPAGHITRGPTETTLRMVGEVASPAEFADFRLPLLSGKTIPLSEVADILDTTEELRESSTYNGQPVIGLSVMRRSDGNTVAVARGVREVLAELEGILDDDIEIAVTNDMSSFVESSVADVQQNIVIGILLTALLLFIFLHDWRQTLIAAISMPVSVIATFLLIDASGFSVNVMTMMALGISIGTLVTNAIVVIENITRMVKSEGIDPFEAAEKGTAQVAVAVLASTLTNIVVFTPIAFMSGIIGRFFIQFGLTVVYATLFSLVISFTMVPMLAARLIRPGVGVGCGESKFACAARAWDRFYERLTESYRRSLSSALDHRWRPILGAVLLFVFAIFLFGFVGGEFMPVVDQGACQITMELPAGTSLERTVELAGRIEATLRARDDVEGVVVKVGGGQRGVEDAAITVKLVPAGERDLHLTGFMNDIRPLLAGIPDAEIMVVPADEGGMVQADLVMEVLGDDQGELDRVAFALRDIFYRVPGLVEIQTSAEIGKPELAVKPRRRQMSDRGLAAASVGQILRAAYEGEEAGVYRESGEEYDVVVKYADESRTDPASLADMPIATPLGTTVPLSDVGVIEERVGSSTIYHADKQRKVEVTANIATGTLSEARAVIDGELAKIDVPDGMTIRYAGMADIQDESFASIFEALILAIILIYIVMAAILESFVHPITVMLTLPLGLIGMSLGLFFTGQTINILSLMSYVMLIGIVVNNAILLLDYTAQLRAKGAGIREALIEACPTRLRPIIMSNLAIAIGMLPQTMGGAGNEYRVPMAVVQIGGVIMSAVFTLYLIPVAYTLMDRLTGAGRRERRARRTR
ncbi:MAG: efflux RND transporter permease subunit [Candidatus Krumholzibacteriota bacterium]|nr:efflux RND transporter permease subunit [Candidatus Krumholzibacteriota bacterium]